MTSFLRLIKDLLGNDPISGALRTIASAHAKVHEGKVFYASHATDDSSALADNASLDILIKVPANITCHFVWGTWCEGLSQHYFYEAPTTTDDGSELSVEDQNRVTDNSAGTTVFHSPTVTGVGTPLRGVEGKWSGNSAGGGQPGAGNVAASDSNSREIILKSSTNYLIRVTARDASLRAQAEMLWYE